MSRIKKIISLALLLVMIMSMLPQVTWALSVTAPATSATASHYFDAMPGVYEMGDGYAVIWATNFKGTGYIKYTYQGRQYTVYDQKNGIVRTGDQIHVVKVPHEHLLGNSYTVYSAEVTGHTYAATNYGKTISAGPITLKAYDGGEDDFDMLVMPDVHDDLNWATKIAAQFTERDPDLVVFNGDVSNELNNKASIKRLFNIMGTVTGGKYPVVYCRGNFESRDVYATTLLEYFPTETGEFYYDFRYGPLWGVVMDTGEARHDTYANYGGLTNFAEYHKKQEAWLRSLDMDTTASYRVGIYHMPSLHNLAGATGMNTDFTDSIGHLGLQFAVAGCLDRTEVYDKAANKATGIPYETFICGSSKIDAATHVRLSKSEQAAYVTSKTSSGSSIITYDTDVLKADGSGYTLQHVSNPYKNYKIDFSTHIGAFPEPMTDVKFGLNNQFNPTTASLGIVSFVTEPAVFESGGDWYNVVWVTKKSKSDNTAKGTTGYVEYTYKGKNYQVYDEVSGIRRACDHIHSVRIPKEHLNGNTFKVGSYLVQYKTTTTPKIFETGDWVESREYLFEDRSNDKAVNLFVCPDIKSLSTNYETQLAHAKKAVNGFGTSPAYILLNGWTVGQTLNSDQDMVNLINAAATVSGSSHPVIFSRGVAECRGVCAPNLLKYIPTVTGEFYYSVDVGDYTLVNLDTAEDEVDNATAVSGGNTIAKYSGRVFLDQIRADQLNWVNSLNGKKLVAVSSMALFNLDQIFGLGFETALKNKGAVLAIGGHNNSGFTLWETVDGNHIYSFLPQGDSSAGMDFASVLLSGDYAYITESKYTAADDQITHPIQKAVSLSTGETMSYESEMPLLTDKVYTISKPEHLKWVSENCKTNGSFSGYTLRFTNDIDMRLVPFAPIGGNDNNATDGDARTRSFAGIVEGNGFAVKNLNIHSTNNNIGLFGSLNRAAVRGLTLSGGMITGGWFTGGITGYTYKSIIEDCYTDVVVYGAYGEGGGTKVGGVVGMLGNGTVIGRCANYGTVIGTHSNGNAGGLAGQIYGIDACRILNSYNRGNVYNQGTNGMAGGIFGYAGAVTADITNCYNAATVSSVGMEGALVPSYQSDANLSLVNSFFELGNNGAGSALRTGNTWKSAAGSGTISGFSPEHMKAQAFANRISSSVYVYIPNRNEGYPIHIKTTSCADHNYVMGICFNCGARDASYVKPDYYLFGYINGSNYACEEDYQNMGEYRFVNGKLSVIFEQDSYVAVKTEGNGSWYMTAGWQGDADSVTLHNTNTLGVADKLFIPAYTYVTFTLEENANDTLTLSYVKGHCNHQFALEGRTEPDCIHAGELRFWCETCWVDSVQVIKATGKHNYVNGYCVNGCDMPQLKFYGAALVLEDNLRINFKVSSALLDTNGFEDPYVVFNFGSKNVLVEATAAENGLYTFSFSDISPQRMNDEVTATLYATCNGLLCKSASVSYSVAEYCYNQLGKSEITSDAKVRTLLVDLLNYGAAAQKYRSYNTGSLVNANLTAVQKSWATASLRPLGTVQNTNYKVISNPTVTWKGAGLVLEEAVVLRFKLATNSIDGLTLKVRRNNAATVTIPSDKFVSTDGGYYVYYDGLDAGEMSETVYLTVYKNDTAVSNTLSYSIESYAYSKLGTGGALTELLSAMIKYGDAAKAYAG